MHFDWYVASWYLFFWCPLNLSGISYHRHHVGKDYFSLQLKQHSNQHWQSKVLNLRTKNNKNLFLSISKELSPPPQQPTTTAKHNENNSTYHPFSCPQTSIDRLHDGGRERCWKWTLLKVYMCVAPHSVYFDDQVSQTTSKVNLDH